MMSPTVKARMRRRYDRWAPILTLVLGVIGVAGILVGAAAMVANGRQDEARDRITASLLSCFDTYATANAESSRKVRAAAVEVDAATGRFFDALDQEGRAFQVVTRGLLNSTVTPAQIERLNDTLATRNTAAGVLDQKQTRLDEVRQENPVPDPPSTVCKEQVPE